MVAAKEATRLEEESSKRSGGDKRLASRGMKRLKKKKEKRREDLLYPRLWKPTASALIAHKKAAQLNGVHGEKKVLPRQHHELLGGEE